MADVEPSLCIGIIPGTARPGIKSHRLAEWVLSLAEQHADPKVSYELVDLQDFDLSARRAWSASHRQTPAPAHKSLASKDPGPARL